MASIALLQTLGGLCCESPPGLAVTSTLHPVPPLTPLTPQGLVDLWSRQWGCLHCLLGLLQSPFPLLTRVKLTAFHVTWCTDRGESLCGTCCLQNPKKPLRHCVCFVTDDVGYSRLSSVLKETSESARGQYENLH